MAPKTMIIIDVMRDVMSTNYIQLEVGPLKLLKYNISYYVLNRFHFLNFLANSFKDQLADSIAAP